jgi:hypothetical protein
MFCLIGQWKDGFILNRHTFFVFGSNLLCSATFRFSVMSSVMELGIAIIKVAVVCCDRRLTANSTHLELIFWPLLGQERQQFPRLPNCLP